MSSPDQPTERIQRPQHPPPMPAPMNLGGGEDDTEILPLDELLGSTPGPAQRQATPRTPPPTTRQPAAARPAMPRASARAAIWAAWTRRTTARIAGWLRRDDNGLMVVTATVASALILVIAAVR